MTAPRSPTSSLAALPDPMPIEAVSGPLDATVSVPGSKSVTNRALVCAALATGPSVLDGALFADDTEAMLGVLRTVGLSVAVDPSAGRVSVEGSNGRLPPTDQQIDVRQSGTTARFVLPMLIAGEGRYRVTADHQMRARPMAAAFVALAELGAAVEERGAPGHLPVAVSAGTVRSSTVEVPGDASSQFLSGLLLVSPCLPKGLVIRVTTPLVSRPYVDLTIAVMEEFGATVDRPDDSTFTVAPGGYHGRSYRVEPDASAASYPWAAAMICGGRVSVQGLGSGAAQGDMAFLDMLGAMGAVVERGERSTVVTAAAGSLQGGSFDLRHISDTALTLACLAPFASEPLTITGIGFIRRKESDRIAAVATELARCGIRVDTDDDGWTIHPGRPQPSVVDTYGDHRMAMSFALLGLAVPGISIADPACVAKTFPGYWQLLDELRSSASGRR